jgi:hypothetical protein
MRRDLGLPAGPGRIERRVRPEGGGVGAIEDRAPSPRLGTRPEDAGHPPGRNAGSGSLSATRVRGDGAANGHRRRRHLAPADHRARRADIDAAQRAVEQSRRTPRDQPDRVHHQGLRRGDALRLAELEPTRRGLPPRQADRANPYDVGSRIGDRHRRTLVAGVRARPVLPPRRSSGATRARRPSRCARSSPARISDRCTPTRRRRRWARRRRPAGRHGWLTRRACAGSASSSRGDRRLPSGPRGQVRPARPRSRPRLPTTTPTTVTR